MHAPTAHLSWEKAGGRPPVMEELRIARLLSWRRAGQSAAGKAPLGSVQPLIRSCRRLVHSAALPSGSSNPAALNARVSSKEVRWGQAHTVCGTMPLHSCVGAGHGAQGASATAGGARISQQRIAFHGACRSKLTSWQSAGRSASPGRAAGIAAACAAGSCVACILRLRSCPSDAAAWRPEASVTRWAGRLITTVHSVSCGTHATAAGR